MLCFNMFDDAAVFQRFNVLFTEDNLTLSASLYTQAYPSKTVDLLRTS